MMNKQNIAQLRQRIVQLRKLKTQLIEELENVRVAQAQLKEKIQ